MSSRAKPKPPVRPVARPPRVFGLFRDEDVNHVSGEGLVGWGAWWPDDGKTVLRWSPHRSGVAQFEGPFDRLGDMLHIHGHGGRTRIVWMDTDPAAERIDTAPFWAKYEAWTSARDKATGGTTAHLDLAVRAANALGDVLSVNDRLADELAALRAQVAKLRAEADSMQEALDVIADVDAGTPVAKAA